MNTLSTLHIDGKDYHYYSLPALAAASGARLERLPYSIRILLEMALRKQGQHNVSAEDAKALLNWQPRDSERAPAAFFPGRVLLQDLSGVPVLNDLAGLRAALVRRGGNPERINPIIPVDLVIDHSVQVDVAGLPDAFAKNAEREFERNHERYTFLRWAQGAFNHLRIVPPASGICHQVNLEWLAQAVMSADDGEYLLLFPDTVVGTDSHTTMINGLGVAGFGVGGIEAIAAMLGHPVEIPTPDVVGVRLEGTLPPGVTATDLTLTVTQMLRKQGVVDCFVEFCGPGAISLPVADRAMVANMAPEYGATMAYFPFDEQSLAYLRLTGRSAETIRQAEAYYRANGLFRATGAPEPEFSTLVTLDLGSVEPSLAGPKRPQDRVPLARVKETFHQALTQPKSARGFGLAESALDAVATIELDGQAAELRHGTLVLAAITSCTNTSNPSVLAAAGLLAQKAVARGLKVPAHVRTSLAPGSRAVTAFLERAGLLPALEALGFGVVAYGCTTCIGNSGPLPPAVVAGIQAQNLVTAAVLSGNRNFEGRVTPYTQANYLASPPLVVAYALAGTLEKDLLTEPLGLGSDGQPVYLREIFPAPEEVQAAVAGAVDASVYQSAYDGLLEANARWNAISAGGGQLYAWKDGSTYLQEPPFFDTSGTGPRDLDGLRVLALLGDSVTTDHISPAGEIPANTPAGQWLRAHGVEPVDFNTYGARRGNDRVLTRGTFANIRLRNLLAAGREGGWTVHLPTAELLSIYEAAQRYRAEGTGLVVVAGKEYGTGSSRDWAAKGAQQLGVKAILAESFERIHRSNLAGMGVLPLQFMPGENASTLGLSGQEVISVHGVAAALATDGMVRVSAVDAGGRSINFQARLRLDTANEREYYRRGGLLPAVLEDMGK